MENCTLRLREVISHAPDVKSFRFAVDREIPYKPGQYLVLTLPLSGLPVSKAFSISSSPTEKGFIQFTKKLSPSDFSKELNALTPGEVCQVRYPLGHFIYEGQFPKVAFLIGGIGITPIRSIFKYAADTGLDASLVLLYSSRTPDYLIFRDDLTALCKAHANLNVIFTLTDCYEEIEGCRKGYIDEDMVRQEIPDYAERIFYSCGPPAMVSAMRRMLNRKLAVLDDHIITEDFLGY